MKTLKIFLCNRFNIIFTLSALILASVFLLSLRLKITQSFFYLFLVWNLFLAIIPYLISSYLIAVKGLKKWKIHIALLIWLLFLPNAPYLLTDFIHLQLSPTSWLGYDVFMIGTFAITGLALYFLSLKDVHCILRSNFNKGTTAVIMFIVPFLTGFGIYLGRFLRWNSWDVLHRPHHLFMDVLNIVIKPFQNAQGWAITISFGLLLGFGQWFSTKYLTK